MSMNSDGDVSTVEEIPINDSEYLSDPENILANLVQNETDKARNYQASLVELAKGKNLIVCLPTGSGKTFIALQLTKHYLSTAIKESKHIVFLATTVPLVHQQASYFNNKIYNAIVGDETGVRPFTGDMNVDNWSRTKWLCEFAKFEILVMTPQIFLDIIEHGHLSFSEVLLLILDECHHAGKDHPMSKIMDRYREYKLENNGSSEIPRILGLTATIIRGVGSIDNINNEVLEIENVMNSKAVTYHNYEEVLKFSTSAKLEYVLYRDNLTDMYTAQSKYILAPLREVLSYLSMQEVQTISSPEVPQNGREFVKNKNPIKVYMRALSDVIEVYDELGLYSSRLVAVLKIAFLSTLINKENTRLADMRGYAITNLMHFITRVEVIMGTADRAIQVANVSNKLQALIDLIMEFRPEEDKNSDKGQLCAIVFVAKRVIAQILSWYFTDLAKHGTHKYKFIHAAFIIGSSTKLADIKETRVTAQKQEKVVQWFHEKRYNLVFATSVLEEGLDVPSCSLVVRFDEINSYPSYVQSMGRARKLGSRFCVITNETEATRQKLNCEKFRDYNNALSNHLREHVLRVDDEDKDISIYPETLPPFCPGGTADSPKVTMTAAISLVHQYCAILPCYQSHPHPPTSWWIDIPSNDGPTLFQAFVKFPHNSVVRDIVKGPLMVNTTLAKRAAFLEACKELHKHNGLDNYLFPCRTPLPQEVVKFLQEVERTDPSSPESKIKFPWYRKKVPNFILGRTIELHQPFDVFVIHLILADPSRDESDSLFNFQSKSLRFGLIVPTNIGTFAGFQLEGKFGYMYARFEKVNLKNEKFLSPEQKLALEEFQEILFEKILCIKFRCAFSTRESPLLVVPLAKGEGNGDYSISWKVVQDAGLIDTFKFNFPTKEERNNFKLLDDYSDAVLVPWYKNDNVLYNVMSVYPGRNIDSKFEENMNYDSYRSYFMIKFKLQANCESQPMLKCSVLSNQLNFLSPKHEKSLSKTEQRSYRGKSVCFPPEFCRLFPFPSSLLVQAKFIPSIIHRIYRLLVAEQIKLDVAKTFSWNAAMKPESSYSLLDDNETEEDHIPKTFLNLCIQRKVEKSPEFTKTLVSTLLTPNLEEGVNKQNEKIYLDLDYIHPDDITTNDIEQIKKDKLKAYKSSNVDQDLYQLYETPRQICLRDINEEQETVKNLDLPTDFALKGGPSSHSIMEAMTVSNANDCVSLERLETMGDSFLKYCVSVQIFCEFPTVDEGILTQIRSKLISNKHLFKFGMAKKLNEYLSGSIFNELRAWLPPGYRVPAGISKTAADLDTTLSGLGNLSKTELEAMSSEERVTLLKSESHKSNQGSLLNTTYEFTRLSNKSIADTVEALIGAYFTNGGQDCALRFMEWLGLKAPSVNGEKVNFGIWKIPVQIRNVGHGELYSVNQFLPFISQLETIICYKFKDPWLCVEAFTHSSFSSNSITRCYQRLEFLGDAVLDFLVTSHIFTIARKGGKPALTPGELTDLRSALVNNITFGSLAVRYGLHKYLLCMSSDVQDSINIFVGYQESRNHQVTGHFTLLNNEEGQLAEEVEAPKILGDVFESLAGAIYLDCNMQLDVTWKVFYRLLENEINQFSQNVPKSPVREIYEKFPGNVSFKSLSEELKKKNQTFNGSLVRLTVLKEAFYGIGTNKVSARIAAAKLALASLNNKNLNRKMQLGN